MKSQRFAFLAVACLALVAFACSPNGSSVDNPVGPATSVTQASATSAVLEGSPQGRTLICHNDVDDDSPDLTWQHALDFAATHPHVRVMRRSGEKGLSTAVIRG